MDSLNPSSSPPGMLSLVQPTEIQEALKLAFASRWIDISNSSTPQTTYTEWRQEKLNHKVITADPQFSSITALTEGWTDVLVPRELYEQALALEIVHGLQKKDFSPALTEDLLPDTDSDLLPVDSQPDPTLNPMRMRTPSPLSNVPATPATAVLSPFKFTLPDAALLSISLPAMVESDQSMYYPGGATPPPSLPMPELRGPTVSFTPPKQSDASQEVTLELFAPDMDLFDSEGSDMSVKLATPNVTPPRPSRSREPSVSSSRHRRTDPPVPTRVTQPDRSRSPLVRVASVVRRAERTTHAPTVSDHTVTTTTPERRDRSRTPTLTCAAETRTSYPEYAVYGIILPHHSSGYRPYARGFKAAQIDIEASGGYVVYIRPTDYAVNLKRREDYRRHHSRYTSKFLCAPRTEGPLGVKRSGDHYLVALGLYGSVEVLLVVYRRARLLRYWPEFAEVEEDIRAKLKSMITRPQAPLMYPIISRNTEEMGQQHVFPYTGHIRLNPMFDHVEQHGSELVMPGQLIRVCPLRNQGCKWEGTSLEKFEEHFNLSHLRFVLLFLCPAKEDCVYLGSTVNDVVQHITDKVHCPDHRQMTRELEEDPRTARSCIVPVRAHHPGAMLADGFPAILDYTPDSGVNRDHPRYKKSWKKWLAIAQENNLFLVPNCPNTVRVRTNVRARDLTKLEASIRRVLMPRDDENLRVTLESASDTLIAWNNGEETMYNVPSQPHPSLPVDNLPPYDLPDPRTSDVPPARQSTRPTPAIQAAPEPTNMTPPRSASSPALGVPATPAPTPASVVQSAPTPAIVVQPAPTPAIRVQPAPAALGAPRPTPSAPSTPVVASQAQPAVGTPQVPAPLSFAVAPAAASPVQPVPALPPVLPVSTSPAAVATLPAPNIVTPITTPVVTTPPPSTMQLLHRQVVLIDARLQQTTQLANYYEAAHQQEKLQKEALQRQVAQQQQQISDLQARVQQNQQIVDHLQQIWQLQQKPPQ